MVLLVTLPVALTSYAIASAMGGTPLPFWTITADRLPSNTLSRISYKARIWLNQAYNCCQQLCLVMVSQHCGNNQEEE